LTIGSDRRRKVFKICEVFSRFAQRSLTCAFDRAYQLNMVVPIRSSIKAELGGIQGLANALSGM
jgi:hypothetical protein